MSPEEEDKIETEFAIAREANVAVLEEMKKMEDINLENGVLNETPEAGDIKPEDISFSADEIMDKFISKLKDDFGLEPQDSTGVDGTDLFYGKKFVIGILKPNGNNRFAFKTFRADWECNGVKHFFKVYNDEDAEREYDGVKDWFEMNEPNSGKGWV